MTLTGKGFFIWKIRNCENGDPGAIASMAQDAGLSHILIKIANGVYSYNIDWDTDTDLVPDVAQALKAVGIQVWGWHYVYGDDPIGEARKAKERIAELDLDGYVIDAEAQYKDIAKKTAARTFMTELRKGLPNIPVALSSYRYPSYHPQLPWDEFLEKVDLNMPQIYWLFATNPAEQLASSLQEFGNMKFQPPIIPIGAAFSEHGWSPTAKQIAEFLQAAKDLNLSAVNFWEWSSCRNVLPADIWDTIRDFQWDGGVQPPKDISGKLIAALNSGDPDEVSALYSDTAVHVIATRTVQGIDPIKAWYSNVLNHVLPNGKFTLTSYSGTGPSRHLTWTATSANGIVQNGNDTLGLIDEKIAYHYTYFTVTA